MELKSTNKIETNKYELKIEISAEEFAQAVNKAERKGAAKMTLPGFRKGHAPIHMIEKMYGREMFYEDALNDIYPGVVDEAIEKSGLDLAERNFEFDMESIGEEGVKFSIKVTVKPEVTLGEYKGIKTTRPDATVSDEDVTAEIDRMRERNARVIDVDDRPAELKDMTVIDFEGFVDGKAFEGGKGENYSLELGSGQFIPGFEEQIVGHKIGDEFDVNVTFPEDYHAGELKGKAAVFKVKLNSIKTRELPELDDEFVKDVSEFSTVDELKKDILEKLTESKNRYADNEVEKQLVDAVIDGMKAEIPQCMIENKINEAVEDFAYRLQMQGIAIKEYLTYTGMDNEKFREGFKETAERQVKLRLALEEIASREKLEATAEDVEAKYAELAKGYAVDVERVKAVIPEKEVKGDIVCDKAITLIKDSAING